jgi:hypothetical protein
MLRLDNYGKEWAKTACFGWWFDDDVEGFNLSVPVDVTLSPGYQAAIRSANPEIRMCAHEGCECTLGEDAQEGDVCAPHRRSLSHSIDPWVAEQKCARKGCGLLKVDGGQFCHGHALCASAVSCDNLEAIQEAEPNPVNVEEVMGDAIEFAWASLADDDRLDPATVAACKRLRDLERRVLS